MLSGDDRFWIIVFFEKSYQVLVGLVLQQRRENEPTNEVAVKSLVLRMCIAFASRVISQV